MNLDGEGDFMYKPTVPGRLFITDFDGTLLRDDKRIAKRDADTLRELGAHGVVRVLATGRSVYSFKKIIRELGLDKGEGVLPMDYVVFSTGAGIMDFPGCRVLKSYSLSATDVVRIADCFERMALDYMVHEPVPDTKNFLYRSHGGENPDFDARIALYRAHCAPLDGNLEEFGRATEVLAVVPEDRAGVIREVRRALTGFSVIGATSPLDRKSLWIEVFHEGVSKSQAVSLIAERHSADAGNAVAVGNDYNDRDLLEWTGSSFVVENAPADLREMFDTVPSNNCCGVSKAAEHFFACMNG